MARILTLLTILIMQIRNSQRALTAAHKRHWLQKIIVGY